MFQAGHHNNKVNKVVSGTLKSHARCSRATHPFLRRTRNRRYIHLKLAKSTSSPLAPAQINGAVAPATAARLASAKLELPASLERPTLKEVNTQTLYKSCPDLKDTPPSYVRQQLQSLAPAMLVGLQSAHVLASKSQLPQELQVLMSDSLNMAGVAPTHILALFSSKPSRTASGSPQKVTLFPIHSMVFAANCSSFPMLPFSAASTPGGNTTRTLTLPVVRLAVPSPESFHILSTYLYSKDVAALQQSLLPTNWATNMQSTVQKAFFIHGLWMNARAFGVVDAGFWEAIEECWADVIRALSQLTVSTSSL